MARADLHVHSKHSGRPSEWFLQRLGAQESYSEPETVYRLAKAAGMDFVTITDHNCIDGCLELRAKHPEDTFVSVETTTYFPEDGCKIHILVYGLSEEQFEEIECVREDVRALSQYLKSENLAHSVAHATYAVNKRLTVSHVEQLLLLFDVFEEINGARDERHNDGMNAVLHALGPLRLRQLEREHGVFSSTDAPWHKGRTGGSDDHAGLFIAASYTEAPGGTVDEFLGSLRTRESAARGRSNDYRGLAFSLYKIATEFSQMRGSNGSAVLEQLNALVFEGEDERSLRDRLAHKIGAACGGRRSDLLRRYSELVSVLRSSSPAPLCDRLDVAYDACSELCDEFGRSLVGSAEKHLKSGDLTGIARSVSSALPAAFILAPFFTALSHMHGGYALVDEVRERFGVPAARPHTVAWFTDTYHDVNGVSTTLQRIARRATQDGADLHIVTGARSRAQDVCSAVVELDVCATFSLPLYESQQVAVPSLLQALKRIDELAPSEILVSTPGPVGAIGLLAAKMFGIPCTAVYHTDFGAQVERFADAGTAGLVDLAIRWFYNAFDIVLVPSSDTRTQLEAAGFDGSKLRHFERTVDLDVFAPVPKASEWLSGQGLSAGDFTMVYAGRVSEDKRLGLLMDAFELAAEQDTGIRLLVVGDGPDAEKIAARCSSHPRASFVGRIAHEEMPLVYSACDLMVFPSTTDTFGMAVLEAQACKLPALVSATGGPKEIISPGETGWVVGEQEPGAWAEMMLQTAQRARRQSLEWRRIRDACRLRACDRHGDEPFIQELFLRCTRKEKPPRRAASTGSCV